MGAAWRQCWNWPCVLHDSHETNRYEMTWVLRHISQQSKPSVLQPGSNVPVQDIVEDGDMNSGHAAVSTRCTSQACCNRAPTRRCSSQQRTTSYTKKSRVCVSQGKPGRPRRTPGGQSRSAHGTHAKVTSPGYLFIFSTGKCGGSACFFASG